LDNSAGDSIDGVYSANLVRAEAEPTGELEGKMGIGLVGDYPRIVEKDGKDLVVSDRMQGEECV
jgi:hypothetical protein